MARRAIILCSACDIRKAEPGHYLCVDCWVKLPMPLRRDIARARVTGATARADALRTQALAHLDPATAVTVYARIAAQLGERD